MIFIEFSLRNEKTNENIYDTFKFISSNREDSIEIGKKFLLNIPMIKKNIDQK
jgi:hypothetical protein